MIDLNDPAVWDEPTFPVAVAAAASLLEAGTLRMWFLRKNIELRFDMGDIDAAGAGLSRLLSLRSVLTIAATAALTRSYVPVRQAFKAALNWTLVAHANPNDPPRIPAGLFAAPARSFLIYAPGEHARIVSVTLTGAALPFDFSDLFAAGYPVRHSPTIVFLDSIDNYARGVCGGFLR